MCCNETEMLDLPPEAIEALAHYRSLRDRHGWDWGEEDLPGFFRWQRFSKYGPVLEAYAELGDWAQAIRTVVADPVPAGVVVLRVDEAGALHADRGPARVGIPGHPVRLEVVIDSALGTEVELLLADRVVRLEPRGARVETIDLDGSASAFPVRFGDAGLVVDGVITPMPAARLRLVSSRAARWSVTDAEGGAWFPEGLLQKWDVHHRPFFHGRTVTLEVPAGPLTIACARGVEFDRIELQAHPSPGETATVESDPERLFDPAAAGWYGADLHVHQNYSGDLVCTPEDAARMQQGEGLHLANLVAGNLGTSRVYDRELLEHTAGTDLPWSSEHEVARMGVEYRNDLLGHVHGLGSSAAPERYYAGHPGSDRPDCWPPNSVACKELRDLDATVGYAHPSLTDFPGGSTDRFFAGPGAPEARELVADAALGLVDSVDLISPFDDEGAVFLYHRLLSCGIRLAATAGTDVFLSFSHGPGVASNPPGWGRVYAHLDGAPLSVEAFKHAIRAGRTVVTNGPWLTLEVAGQRPGAVLDLTAGDRIDVVARSEGPGVERLEIVGPDGVLAEARGTSTVELSTTVAEPGWIAAIARGPGHPHTLDASVFAHTSPVYVDLDGTRVRRAADAQWCLDFLDSFREFVHSHGHFQASTRRERLGDLDAVVDRAKTFYREIGVNGRGL